MPRTTSRPAGISDRAQPPADAPYWTPPIFRDGDDLYRIDSCRPQIRAMEEGKIEMHALGRGSYPGDRLGPDDLPGVPCMGFWDAHRPQDWGLELHRNEGVEISLLETGHMDFMVDDQTIALQQGDLTITRPWQLHRLGLPHIGPGRVHWVILDVGVRRPNQDWVWPDWVVLTPRDLGELTERLRHNENPVWHSSRETRGAFQRIARALVTNRAGSHLSHITVSLNRMLLCVLDLLREAPKALNPDLISRRRTVELFLEDLRTHPQALGEEWTVGGMAAECGMGVTAFTQYCRESSNTSPMEFLRDARLAFAAGMLIRRPDLSITEIALTCGFNSSQYFAACFRRTYGYSPTMHRIRIGGARPGSATAG